MENLETKRLNFRLYEGKDKRMFIALMTDAEVMKRVGDGVLTPEGAEKLWKKLLENFYPGGEKTIWAIWAKENGRYIGHASIRPRPEKKEDWEIGYIIRREEWGKGFASEIAMKLVDYGFKKLKLPEIFATIDDENYPSIKVAEKAGLRFSNYEFDDLGRFSVYSIKSPMNKNSK
ncbi:MAG: GNAT family N-acetyltransferase [Pyrinomonadaceae bacterium]